MRKYIEQLNNALKNDRIESWIYSRKGDERLTDMKNTVKTCLLLFCLLLLVHGFEAIVLRMDETFFGENFINKLFGILVVWITLRRLNWSWSDIGFTRT